MSSGGGKRQEIDKVSGETKKILEKLLKQQRIAEKRGNKAIAQDTALKKQQMDAQNQLSQQLLQVQQQQVQQQSQLATQHQTGLTQQLDMLRNQNSLLQKQSSQQTAYIQSQKEMQQKQLQLQAEQRKRAEEETRYTSALEAQESRNAGATANRLTQQLNRRRAIARMTR